MASSKVSHSVMFAGTASGTFLPPHVVYKVGDVYDTWDEGGPQGERYSASQVGGLIMHYLTIGSTL